MFACFAGEATDEVKFTSMLTFLLEGKDQNVEHQFSYLLFRACALQGRSMCYRSSDCRFLVLGFLAHETVQLKGKKILSVDRSTASYLGCIANGGKNRDGKGSKTGCFPHYNPIYCPVASVAEVLLFRYLILGEERPRFHKPWWWGPLLRSPRPAKAHLVRSRARARQRARATY